MRAGIYNKVGRVVLLSTSLLCTTALAEKPDAASLASFCRSTSKTAEEIMSARQVGVPMRKLVELSEKQGMSSAAREVIDQIVLAAYRHPRYSTDARRQETVIEFGNEVLLDCMNAVKKRQ